MNKQRCKSVIAVVGNGEPELDYTDSIESTDLILRFNECPHYSSGKTGTRTDVLCVRSYGHIGEEFANGSRSLNSRVVESCKSVWFVGEKGNWAPKISSRYSLHKKQQIQISALEMKRVSEKLKTYGYQRHSGVSLGTIIVDWIRANNNFADVRMRLYGFGFEGWGQHPWKLEERYITFLQFLGLLDIFPSSRFAELVPVMHNDVIVSGNSGSIQLGPHGRNAGNSLEVNELGILILDCVEQQLNFAQICQALRKLYGELPGNGKLEIAQFLWSLEDVGLLNWRKGKHRDT